MNQRHNWIKLKTKFMTGNYKSLREFAKKQGLPYSGNFITKTRGWASERDAKQMQISCKITENSIEQEMKQLTELKQEINEITELLLSITNGFIKNKDYSKFAIKHRANGIVNIIETSYIKINEVNKAANTINKISKILQKAG